MGLVKFGQQTLNIENVPDGSIIIPESDYRGFNDIRNAYQSLKARLPIGVDETQIGVLIEKGQRFDAINGELSTTRTTLADAQEKLKTASQKLPEGFTPEKWNGYVQREQKEARQQALSALTKAVKDKLAKENPSVPPPEVDERFLPADQVSAFDPSASDAEPKWAAIMAAGYKAQVEFMNKAQSTTPPAASAVGGGQGDSQSAPTGVTSL